jgi:hypothetical protein
MWATPTFAGEPGIQRAHQRIPQWSVQDAGETFVIRSYPNLNGTTPLLIDQCPGIVLANHIVAWLAGFSGNGRPQTARRNSVVLIGLPRNNENAVHPGHGVSIGPPVISGFFGDPSGDMASTIFINCRRDDSMGAAGRLLDRLTQAFGRENLFVDFGDIPTGIDFELHLNNWVAACQVFVTIIGPNWLKDKAGQRRLRHPRDFAAIEISAALTGNIGVIPVLVDGARSRRRAICLIP